MTTQRRTSKAWDALAEHDEWLKRMIKRDILSLPTARRRKAIKELLAVIRRVRRESKARDREWATPQ